MDQALNQIEKKIFGGSIVLSICLHLAGIFFLQRQSVWFSSMQQVSAKELPWVSLMEKKEKDEILKEAFEEVSSPFRETSQRGSSAASFPRKESPPCVSLSPTPLPSVSEGANFLASLEPATPFPENQLLTANQTLSFLLPPEKSINLFDHLPKDLIPHRPSHPPSLKPTFAPSRIQTPATLSAASIPAPPEAPTLEGSSCVEIPLPVSPLPEKSSFIRAPSFVPTPNLPKFPSLGDLQTISYSSAFETELLFCPKEGGGYIFALTLIPKPDLELRPLKQNYFFLIDRSNSVQSDRLASTKSAVRKALEELNEGDTFNIFAFDNKLEKFSSFPTKTSPEALQKADEFLDRLELGSFFSQSDLFKPLFLTLPSRVEEDELYTAILMTDGEGISKKGAAQSLLQEWTDQNHGKVSLFTLGISGDPHLNTLETASYFNRGKTLVSPTKRGLKRKLLKLMKTVQAPVAKNLSCRAISRSPKNKIEIFPKNNTAPHLYLNEPYVILGQTEKMEDFILFIQGRVNGEWLHIKKTVSFVHGKRGGPILKNQWALQQAYELYEQYLLDENPKHIADAKLLLEPLNLEAPFP